MSKRLIITVGLVLTILLVVLTSCSGPSTVPASSIAPTNIGPTTAQTVGNPSQGGSTLSPANPPQGSVSGIPSLVIPSPATIVPPIGSPSSGAGASSAGVAAPNIAVAVPAGTTFINQPSFIQPTAGDAQSTGIWVTGQGQVSASPDTASLTLGVDSQATTVTEAQNNASIAMNTVIQVLKNKGVTDQDITTVGFSIYPTYNYKNNTITAYQVSNTIVAKIRNIADAGSIIDGVTSAGGNLIRVSSISFSVDDPTPFLKQARDLAIADATAKANQLATSTGVKLGLPTFITETTGNYVPTPIYFAAGAAAATPVPTTPISPGVTQISVNVQIVYAIQ